MADRNIKVSLYPSPPLLLYSSLLTLYPSLTALAQNVDAGVVFLSIHLLLYER